MRVIDVTAWSAIRAEEMGRDERKTWIAEDPGAPRDEWWLWKPCLATGDGRQRRLNDVAEAVTYQLAHEIGLPTARCELAIRDNAPGVISRNVSPPTMELIHGSQAILPDAAYSLESVALALEGASGPSHCEDMTALQVFTGYLVLDAWIANTDRHDETGASWRRPKGGGRSLLPSTTGLPSGLA